eukprot:TRINITY_DN10930_c0_g2_i1.p1 TRINITY_DN10930_c0_g2~~TRINITY_DN10930_c0_g2_i1.p1  ORF type:complete len:576 (+),score=128.06 TRINITY_DN10930_c0_g2_i1:78-1805(+)
MAAEKLLAFARRKRDEALSCFEKRSWSAGLPRARAALDLLARSGGSDPELARALCRGIVEALAAEGRSCEALEFYHARASDIADESLRERVLRSWLEAANAPAPGDLVQLPSPETEAASGHRQQLVGVVVAAADDAAAGDNATAAVAADAGAEADAEVEVEQRRPARWRVRLRGVAAAGDTDQVGDGGLPAEANASQSSTAEPENGEDREVIVDASDLTLLALRLSEEQRERWRQLQSTRPSLFGERMRPENEARWQKLFGGYAARSQGAGCDGAAAGAGDLGLPLEQSFSATLHGVIEDWLRLGTLPGVDGTLRVDLLGCRPALELADPERDLLRVLQSASEISSGSIRSLIVRMCGPEIGIEPLKCVRETPDGLHLSIQVENGLYHEAFPNCGADIIFAMNAGIGVPQYKASWAPTLDLIAQQLDPVLVAITTYSPGELLREEQLLRRRWAETLSLRPSDVAKLLDVVQGPPPWCLPCEVSLLEGWLKLCQGDVVEPWHSVLPRQKSSQQPSGSAASVQAVVDSATAKALAQGPWSFRLLRCRQLAYAGPNPTPGRSRNYGKLLLWAGGCEFD